jgi:hypothetical protein
MFEDITTYNPLQINRRFGGTCRLHIPAGFLLGLFFDSEDGGDISLEKIS